MTEYTERSYRNRTSLRGMVSFNVAVKETDLWIKADRKLEKESMDLVLDCRHKIESYIKFHPEFFTTLTPYPKDIYATMIVRTMIEEAGKSGVGPMASVAGAIAEYVGNGLLNISEQVIVENGGDIYIKANRPVTVSIFAGKSPLSEKIGLVIPSDNMPVGVCSSSGKVGHSLSMGRADAVCIVSLSTALADGAATSIGNRINSKKDLENVADWAGEIGEILGGVAIIDDGMATWGDIELVGI